jgi:SAM-dependent methyltransferase
MRGLDKDMEDLNVPPISVDEEYGQGFEFLEEEVADSAYSQASSIHNFRMENGRRYHEYKEGHPFPYDEVSRDNEASFHELLYVLLDRRYFLSPITESALHCVADVGTGEGLWAEAVAERYPNAQVVGLDTIPHQRPIEPNCSFIEQNVTEEWLLDNPRMKFDLIYIRNLFVGVTDWEPVYAQCFE